MLKRLLDLIFSALGLIALSPLFAAVAAIIKLETRGPVLFSQERIGKDFRPFKIYKFRTMTADTSGKGPLITVGGDKRITRIGRFLRKTKVDELPQLINVLKGEMSLVGPRPEVRKYVELFKLDYERLLMVRPGITDPASIKFSDEEHLLSLSENWERDYTSTVLPTKIRLSSDYVTNNNILLDLKLILKTLCKL